MEGLVIACSVEMPSNLPLIKDSKIVKISIDVLKTKRHATEAAFKPLPLSRGENIFAGIDFKCYRISD